MSSTRRSTSTTTSPTSSTIRSTATSSSRATSARSWALQGEPHAQPSRCGPRGGDHARHPDPLRRYRASACSTPCSARRSARCATTRCSETSVGLYADSNMTLDRLAARRPSACAATCTGGSVAATRRRIPAMPGVHRQPQGGLVFGPFAKTEFFLNAGLGFHSNDAARRHHHGRSGRPADAAAAACRCWCAPRAPRSACARQAVRGLESAAGAVRARLRFGAPVRRRRRHHRAEPAEPAHRRRMDQPLPAACPGLARSRPRLHPGALHRLRSGRRRPYPGLAGSRRRRPASTLGERRRLVRRACAGATSAPRPLIEDGSV